MKIILKSAKWTIVKLMIFYCLLSSARASMTLGDNLYVDLFLGGICFAYFAIHNKFAWNLNEAIAVLLLSVAAMYTMHGSDRLTAYLGMLSGILIPILLIGLRTEIKIELFNDFSKWLAILLVISVVAWSIHLLGIPLPHSTTVVDMYGLNDTLTIDNYFFFRVSTSSNSNFNEVIIDWLPRFCGFFLEPGHLGTIVSFFLFANRYDFKRWYNIVFLLVIALTLSAAAYTLTAIGILLYALAKKSQKTMLLSLAAVSAFVLIALFSNGGDNLLNEKILGKLFRTEGAISARASYDVHAQISLMMLYGNYFFGIGYQQFANSAGILVYFLCNGLLGCLLVFFSYLAIYSTSPSRLGLFLFVLFFISFFQRVYCFWDAFLDPFILGLPFLAQNVSSKI